MTAAGNKKQLNNPHFHKMSHKKVRAEDLITVLLPRGGQNINREHKPAVRSKYTYTTQTHDKYVKSFFHVLVWKRHKLQFGHFCELKDYILLYRLKEHTGDIVILSTNLMKRPKPTTCKSVS